MSLVRRQAVADRFGIDAGGRSMRLMRWLAVPAGLVLFVAAAELKPGQPHPARPAPAMLAAQAAPNPVLPPS